MKTEFVEMLAKLLSDSVLRLEYTRQPEQVLERNNLRERDKHIFLGISPQQLDAQADILIRKRMRELYAMIPVTMTGHGERAGNLFRAYAECNWPQGHQRHHLDAIRFCEYLKHAGMDFNRSEYYRVRFAIGRARWQIRFVRDAWIGNCFKCAVQVLCRIGKRTYERRFYLYSLNMAGRFKTP